MRGYSVHPPSPTQRVLKFFQFRSARKLPVKLETVSDIGPSALPRGYRQLPFVRTRTRRTSGSLRRR